jgi:hypothetical protein
MGRFTVFLFVMACALLALFISAGCSGGIDQLALQNLESGAINTCGDLECTTEDPADDSDGVADGVSASAYENLICTEEETGPTDNGQSAPFRQTAAGNIAFTTPSLCGRPVYPPVQLATHEPVLPFNPVVFCGDQEVPLNNPHSSCSATPDISSGYINIPTQDFGVCALKIDDKIISTPFFIYRNNGVELTRYEILRTCVEQMSCTLGTFRSAAIPLIEEANESPIISSDITFMVLRTVNGLIVEASDMGNLANATLLLDEVGLPIDDDIVNHNQHHIDEVITFIEDNCVE